MGKLPYQPPVYAAPASLEPEYNRLERKDFWNDPERWDGIDDPRKKMIWEVRHPDRIDVTPSLAPSLMGAKAWNPTTYARPTS